MVAFIGTPPEMPRPIKLAEIGDSGLEIEVVASERERAALAERFDLLEISDLRATVTLRRPDRGALIRVEGRLEASVTQRCVVSLALVDDRIDERFVQLYTLEADGKEEEEIFSPPEEETPEPLTGNLLDVGEAVAEQLGLALNPYPRAPGVESEMPETPIEAPREEDEQPRHRPFAVLKDLKTRK